MATISGSHLPALQKKNMPFPSFKGRGHNNLHKKFYHLMEH